MDRRLRRIPARVSLVAALVAVLAAAAPALAYLTTDLNDFNLTETTSTYGNGSQYHISTGTDGWVSYRWLDSPSKGTVISGNTCQDWALIGGPASIGSGDTSYHSLFQGFGGECFVVRGRTQAGQGSMSLYDGRIQR
jgi:hypothetical protein